MTLFLYFIFCILVVINGIRRAYHNKNLIIILWLIVLYYTITSYISCTSAINNYIPLNIKCLYFRNFLFCVIAFFLSDICFNRKPAKLISFDRLPVGITKILELIFWVSLFLVFGDLYGKNYTDFVTSADGGGWGFVFFQVSAGMILYFAYKKSWFKIAIASLLLLLIVTTTHVRSLFLYAFLPIVIFFIYNSFRNSLTFRNFSKRMLPILIITLIFGFLTSFIRTATFVLPETNLTDISLAVLDKVERIEYSYQGMNSFLHYMWGFISPLGGILGINPQIPDSIPVINATYYVDLSFNAIVDNALHFPANIFHDLYISWGNGACIFAFILYAYLALIIRIIQNRPTLLLLFSSILPWHLFMLLRGSVDYSSMGISYAIYITLIIYFVSKIKIPTK